MPTINLTNPSDRADLASLISSDIDAYCKVLYENDHRNHLGASELGEPCWRKLYYKFRWVQKPNFDGRMLRLFNMGHTAEPRFITYLRGIGFTVHEADPETGKQFRISGAKGHYGGSLDGICIAPEKYGVGAMAMLTEYKTNGTGAAYEKVAKEGIEKAKPLHFAQMSQYAAKYKFEYGLYLIENKNDSSITIQIVKMDWKYGEELGEKAEKIIFSQEPPSRIAENPSFQSCKWCDFVDICHHGMPAEKNCRSCRMSMPIDDGQWHCSRWGATIPEKAIRDGCEQWMSI